MPATEAKEHAEAEGLKRPKLENNSGRNKHGRETSKSRHRASRDRDSSESTWQTEESRQPSDGWLSEGVRKAAPRSETSSSGGK